MIRVYCKKKDGIYMKEKKRYLYSIIAVILLIAADQFTKYLAVVKLKDKNAFVLIPDVFELQYLENRGAAFGIFQGQKVLLVLVTLVFLLLLGWFYHKIPNEKHFKLMRRVCIVLFAGAVGNVIDRIAYNYVIDFFYFKLIDFPIFNVADIYVTVSCVLILIMIIFSYYKDEDFEQIFPSKKPSAGKTESVAAIEKDDSKKGE